MILRTYKDQNNPPPLGLEPETPGAASLPVSHAILEEKVYFRSRLDAFYTFPASFVCFCLIY